MSTILHIDSSVTGEKSVSRVLTQHIINRFSAESPAVVYRDLVAEPLDHMTLDVFADSSVLDEFLGADTVVIGAPMYNFTLPSQLKAWLDRILVAGRTFRYREDGTVEGLAAGKRVIVALSRGGFYRGDAPAAGMEHLETYLTGVFGFIGISPEFVAADGINLGPDSRAKGVETALQEVEKLAA